MVQKIRNIIITISLLLFPITMNFLSPYVSIDGAILGIVSGSILVFLFMFVTAIFFGRAWCSWICPMASLSQMCMNINDNNVNVKKLRIIRYIIFTIWFGILISMFVVAGGVKGIDPLHLTENGISVDGPMKYITYYMVLAIFFIANISIGKRGSCHSFCWMSPFLAAGFKVGQLLKIPQLRIIADESQCSGCKTCNKKCPMSIDVNDSVRYKYVKTSDCILCGECIQGCKKKVLKYGIRK